MSEDEEQSLSPDIYDEAASQIVATLVSFAPVVGGAVQNIISGYATGKKFDRVFEVLVSFWKRISELDKSVLDK